MPPFKARVALAAVKGDRTLGQLASEYGVHATLISQWKRRLLANMARVFDETGRLVASIAQEGLVRPRRVGGT